jgi:hypothetical protein
LTVGRVLHNPEPILIASFRTRRVYDHSDCRPKL